MSNDKEEICFHIMHSMKGGCGKSTCALFRALQLANEKTGESAKVLFLDADFKGSALQPLLFRKDASKSETFNQVLEKMENPSVGKYGIRHTIAIPNDYRKENNLSRFLRGMDIPFNTLVQKSFSYVLQADDPAETSVNGVNGYIDFILVGAESEDKEQFRKHRGKIAAGIFLYRMEMLINSILYHNAVAAADNDRDNKPLGQYEDVVIDMPPGYDEYSDILLEVLRKMATKEKKIKLHYYHVTTNDIGHMELARGNIAQMLEHEPEVKEFCTVNAILNNPFSAKPDSETDEGKEYVKGIGDHIQSLKELLGDKGEVYNNEYNDSFHKYSTITENLQFFIEDSALKKQ